MHERSWARKSNISMRDLHMKPNVSFLVKDIHMVEEIYCLYSTFWSKRSSVKYDHYWVSCTWLSLKPSRYSECKPGDLLKSLHQNFGSDAVGSTRTPLTKSHLI